MKYRLTEDWLEYKKGHVFADRLEVHCYGSVVTDIELSLLLKTGILEEVKEEAFEVVPSPRIDYCCECGNDHGYDCPLLLVKEKLDEVKTLLLSLKK